MKEGSFLARINKTYVIIAIIIIVIIVAVVFFKKDKGKKEEKPSEKRTMTSSRVTSITAITLKGEDVDVFDKSIATIYNLNSVTIAPEVSGLIEKVYVDVGDSVKSGQVLATIDKKESVNDKKSQEASVRQLQSQIKLQQKTLDRYKELKKNGFVSQAELDAANSDLVNLQQQLAGAKSVLANIDVRINNSQVKSKISGIVQERTATEGNYITVGTKMFSVVDNSHLIVIANFPESYFGKLKKGQEVFLKPAGLDVSIKSSIKEIKPIIEEQSRTIQAIIEVGSNTYNLKPGGTVEVSVLMYHKNNVILVPEESVVLRSSGKVVYVLDGDKVKEVQVRTGFTQDNKVEIEEGLKDGQQVAYMGAGLLDDGAPVSVKQDDEESTDKDPKQSSSTNSQLKQNSSQNLTSENKTPSNSISNNTASGTKKIKQNLNNKKTKNVKDNQKNNTKKKNKEKATAPKKGVTAKSQTNKQKSTTPPSKGSNVKKPTKETVTTVDYGEKINAVVEYNQKF